MTKRLGIIGAGNMGSAILKGIVAEGVVQQYQLTVCDRSQKKLDALRRELPEVTFCTDARQLTQSCDMLLLAVKPNVVRSVIDTIRPLLMHKALISIAAGWTVDMLEEALRGTDTTFLRVMPNTPAMVGQGMTAICDDTSFTDEDFAFAKSLFEAIGRTAILPENVFDGVIAVSGSSPAYAYMMIEAMGDAAVREGVPRNVAYEMAAQSLLGSALMVLSTGQHPGKLKDDVCSPAGTTIDAVAVLEKAGFRGAVMDAMHACAEKSRAMSKK